MSTGEIFVAGAIGSIAPEIIRLYEIRSNPDIRFSRFYFVISAVYVALGGYIATIFPGVSSQFWAACVGAGQVLIVNKMVYVGGKLANGISALIKSPPTMPGKSSIGFEHGDAQVNSVRRGNLMDFIRML